MDRCPEKSQSNVQVMYGPNIWSLETFVPFHIYSPLKEMFTFKIIASHSSFGSEIFCWWLTPLIFGELFLGVSTAEPVCTDNSVILSNSSSIATKTVTFPFSSSTFSFSGLGLVLDDLLQGYPHLLHAPNALVHELLLHCRLTLVTPGRATSAIFEYFEKDIQLQFPPHQWGKIFIFKEHPNNEER